MKNLIRSIAGMCVLGVTLLLGSATSFGALLHRYSFSEVSGTTINDSVGTAHGTITNGANTVVTTNYGLTGTSLVLTNAGANGTFVDLPNGIISSLTNATFEAWVTWNGSANWQRIFDFGNSLTAEGTSGTGSNYVLLTAKSGNSGTPAVFGGRWFGQPADMTVSSAAMQAGVQIHLVATFDWNNRVAKLYSNGVFMASAPVLHPLSEIADVNNWLGRSQFSGDPYFIGAYNEFRIYDSALSAAQIATNAVAGPDVIAADPGAALAVRLIVTNANLFPNTVMSWRTQQVYAVADFATASNVNVTIGDGSVYTSSDTNIFTVDSFGVVRARNPGSATLTVNYQSVSDAKTVTVVSQDKPVLIHRYSFEDGAGTTVTDSVGVAHGTIVASNAPTIPGSTNFFWAPGRLSLMAAGQNAAYVDLPNGLISSMTNATFEIWVTFSNAPAFARILDFGLSNAGENNPGGVAGNGGSNYLFLAPSSPLRFAIKPGGIGETAVNAPGAMPQNALTHIVCTYNPAVGYSKLFVNGQLAKVGPTPMQLRNLNDLNNWLGRSQYNNDPFFKGDYHEFRIYEGTMSEGDVAASFAAGPDSLSAGAGNLVSIALQVTNVMSGAFPSQVAVVLANYQNISGINITTNTDVTFFSSDSTVASVSAAGVITALRPGTTTIRANFRDQTTSAVITVLPGNQSLAHRYNFNEGGSGTTVLDLVGGPSGNATIIGTNFSRTATAVAINATNSAVQTTYIDLPNGIVSSLSNATFEGWTTWTDWSQNWQRIFDFGLSDGGEGNSGTGTNSFFMSPRNGANSRLRWEIHTNTALNVVTLDTTGNPLAFPSNALTHFAVVYSATANAMYTYVNGVKVGTITTTIPLAKLRDLNNWLGRSQFNDPYYRGSFNEFRIYANALLDAEVLASFNAGPDAVLTPPSIVNLPPKAVTPATAFPAGVLGTNQINSQVLLYWGTSDGGTTPASWTNVVDLGTQLPGQVFTKISGLTAGQTYFYRYFASNAFGTTWAATSQNFTTPTPFVGATYAYVMTNVFTGYTNPEPLINFPALIVLNTNIPNFSYSQFLSPSAADLRFVDGSGKELNYEIETWNTNGNSFVWVQVPEFTNRCAIQMNWGKAGLPIPAYSTNGATWADGFAGVWHMTNSLPKDSSAHGFDATFVNTPLAVTPTSGVVGTAQDYNAAIGNAYTYVGTNLNFTNMTLSAWVWCRDANRQGIFMCKDGSGSAGDLYFWQQSATLRAETFAYGGDTVQQLANSGAAGNWIHLAFTVNGLYQTIYTNGVLAALWTKGTYPGRNADQFQLAGSVGINSRYHNGRLDEMRAEYVPRSAAWIQACYLNQTAPAAFQTVSPIVARALPLSFNTPAVTNIDTTTAGFYVRVISDGGNGVGSFGSAWDSVSSPNNNLDVQVMATNAPFDILRPLSGLTPGGHYYARGFASNAIEGTVYSADAEFYTEPLSATGVTFQNVSNSSMTISWTPGSGSSGSLVVMRQGAAITALPADGASYSANAQFSAGSDLGAGTYVVYSGAGSSVNVANLRRNTNYYVAVFSFAGSGVALNYQQDDPATGVQSTASTLRPDVAGQLLIELHSSRGVNSDANGAVAEWINYGSVGGSFIVDGDSTTYPTTASVSGKNALSFDGGDRLKATFAAPKSITGVNGQGAPEDYSVEYWVFNPDIASEEWLFTFARRGTQPRYAAFGYGTNNAFGATAHWSTPDMAFGEGISTPGLASTPVAGVWHHIVATYDGSVERVYVDGALNAQEGKILNIWDGDPVTLGQSYTTGPFAYATTIPFSGSIVGLRVHSGALSAVQVANNYSVGSDGIVPAGAPRITTDPISRTVADGDSAAFSISAIGEDPMSFQWLRNGAPVTGATNRNYTTPLLSVTDSGAQFVCLVSNFFGGVPNVVTSAVANLTVLSAANSLTHRWPFDTDANDVIGTAHGALMNGASVTGGVVVLNNPGAPASSTAGQFVDLPNNLVMTYTSVTFEAWYTENGNGNWARIWDFGNGTGGEGSTGTGTNYLFSTVPNAADGGIRYGTRIGTAGEQFVTYPVRPAQGAQHQVAVTHDGVNQVMKLYVDGVLVAMTTGANITPSSLGSTFNDWLGRSQFGGDAFFNGSIAEFRIYNTALTSNRVQQNFQLGPDSPPNGGPVVVWKNPTNTTTVENRPVTFTADVNGNVPMQFQWYKNSTPISGATNLVLTFNPVLADNGAAISMRATNVVSAVTYDASSTAATLTVLADTNAPIVLGAVNLDTTTVLVGFSEVVDASLANNTASYSLSGPGGSISISSAALQADGLTVLLTTAPLSIGSTYTLTIGGITDIAATPNMLYPNPTSITFVASPFTFANVGAPGANGHFFSDTNGFHIVANGTGIGGANDQFAFAYQQTSGDFDVQVRLGSLGLSDTWASAGLMARETLDANSKFAASLGTPSIVGSYFQSRATVGGTAVTAGSFPANYPNSWLRLQRVGNLFSGYASYDGQTWSLLSSATISASNTLYVGLAVASRNASQTTAAQFTDSGNTVSTNVGTVTNPSEPLGPSTRRTGLVISEIMYKPAPRGDGKNIEFVEIYNSNPFLYDLSGHRLSGDIGYTFPAGTIIQAGQFIVVAKVPADVQSVYGISGVFGPYTGSLKTSGTVRVRSEIDAVLLEVNYDNNAPWPVAADGTGHSLVLARPSFGENDPRAWDISDVVGGSPEAPEAFRPSALRNVVINEVLANSSLLDDYVELYNHSNLSNDISGCVLTDNASTNKFVIPNGTVIPPGGFIVFNQTQLGFGLKSSGDNIYFKNATGTRVLDVVKFDSQGDGISLGRWPDGASSFYVQASRTPGAANSGPRNSDIVINELMYHPISGNDDDQFVELYNKGTNVVSLAGWKFTSGISFTFPGTATIAPDSYVVVAANAANLISKYTNLNAANTYGNFSGKLSHNGERVVLSMPEYNITTNNHGAFVTNAISVIADEVTYGTGGRWGQWSDGGGSSLELIDARSDRRLAANWADSDDTAKSLWTNIEWTGVLDNGSIYNATLDNIQLGVLDAGEALVDNVEVLNTNGVAYLLNGDFEAGANGWLFTGDHVRSSIDTNGGFGDSFNALHLRTGNRMWTVANAVSGTLTNTTLAAGQVATLRFKARWLHGWPEVLMRLHGNFGEATGPLPLPANLGTPGARNSRAVTNAGPAIYEVTHQPALPAANQPVVVVARVSDPDGVASLAVNYRIDPGATIVSVPMNDGGTNGDAIAGDGVYSATVPGQASGVLVAFNVTATDSLGASTRFPALSTDNTPTRECLVRFGEPNPTSSFGTYHIWLSQANLDRWNSLPDLSNEDIDLTWVYNGRAIYNAFGRYGGSPYHQSDRGAIENGPNNGPAHLILTLPADDMLLGYKSFNKIGWIGNDIQDDTATANNNDATLQREQAANMLLRGLGQPWVYRRFVGVYVNGTRRGQLMEDALRPHVSVPDVYYPDEKDGFVYKIQPWFEGARSQNADGSTPWANKEWAYYQPFYTTNNNVVSHKTPRYRWHYEVRDTPGSANDYTNVFRLVEAGAASANSNFVSIIENVADMENWMRLVAANHAAGNWDCWGVQNAQNIYGYVSPTKRWTMFMFDFNIVLGNRISWTPGQNLFVTPPAFGLLGADTNWANIMNTPKFRRMYLRALKELANGAMTSGQFDPTVDAKYQAFLANGLAATDSSVIKSWVASARLSILSQINPLDANGFGPATNSYSTSNNVVTINGTAPVEVTKITLNGLEVNQNWLTPTTFSFTLPVLNGATSFTMLGYNRFGQLVSGASNQVNVINDGAPESPLGNVVFNEIMFTPVNAEAEYIELFNNSFTSTFDLSGWQVNGLSYTFPANSTIAPRSYLVLAKSRTEFANTYGVFVPVFDSYGGNLQSDGETLSLIIPGPTNTLDVIVDQVRYEAIAPWPATSAGVSLQLIDPAQDNSRAGNWAAFAPTPGALNATNTSLPAFPTLWLNEVEADNLTGITDTLGHRNPWVEIYNGSTNSVSLDNLFLTDTYTNLAKWAFPSNVTLTPGQYYVVFCDGETNETTTSELHTSFRIASGSGSIALTRLVGDQPQVVDYLNYRNIPVNNSYGDFPNGQPFYRQAMFYPTPRATNDASLPPIVLFINEWMAANTHTLADPADGKYDDWFELYNPNDFAVNLQNWSVANSTTNATQFIIPAGYTVPAHGYFLIWADSQSGQNSSNRADLHVSFKLSKAGEVIGLFSPERRLVDSIIFGAQQDDVSQGRSPDGSANIMFQPVATPRTTNYFNHAPVIPAIVDQVIPELSPFMVTIPWTDGIL